MANITFGYNNRCDGGTLSGGNWAASLPQTNLQSRLISKVARTSGKTTSDTIIKIDLGSAYRIGVVALIAHNFSTAATVRVRGNSSATMTTPLYDSTALEVWPGGVIDSSLLEWEDDNFWLATVSSQMRAGFNVPYINLDATCTVARYWQIDIDDSTATQTDGYVQIGRLFLSDIWQPGVNYSYSAELGYEDPTVTDTSVNGEEFFDQRSRYRVMRMNFGWATESEAYNRALEMQRLLGSSGEVLVIPDSADTSYGIRRNFVGRMRNLSPVVIQPTGMFSTGFELKELL